MAIAASLGQLAWPAAGVAAGLTQPTDGAKQDVVQPGGLVTATGVAPITVPATGAGLGAVDQSIGGAPIFLPYTPPSSDAEIAGDRTLTSRTLAHPDGTFSQETSQGPINYQDPSGSWQPIDLSLVADESGPYAYRVAANQSQVRFGANADAIASISIDGHEVKLASTDAAVGSLGAGDTRNELTYASKSIAGPQIYARPIDIGVEFGATWNAASQTPTASFTLDAGDLTPKLDTDGETIAFLDSKGAFAGRIDAPILRQGGVDGPPFQHEAKVTLLPLGPGTYTLSYAVDPLWFSAKDRIFPLVLDPTWCIGQGSSGAGCDDYNAGVYSGDSFIFSANPDSYEVGWTTMRVGYDVRSDDGDVYGTMRGLVWFAQVALPDGAVVYDTDFQMHIGSEYGGPSGETIRVARLTKALTSHYTWTKFNNTYDTTTGYVDATVPSSGYMHWDTDNIVHSWYTRTPKDWKAPYGFMVKMVSEGSSHGEVEFSRYSNGTTAYRPLLTLTYTVPVVGIDFDPRLGTNYAPSNMVAGVPTKVPVVALNKSGSGSTLTDCATSSTNCWKVGYRWFDAKGNTVGGGTAASTVDLPSSVTPGSPVNKSAVFPISVTPPSTTGEYTLRLDLVHYYFGSYSWSSDWSTPSKYYSRNKKILSAASTRWTGSSVVERDEFGVNVVAGAGGGNIQTVKTGTGDQLGIDLFSHNLSYTGDTGLGFSDRIPLTLTYGYNESNATACAGYLGILKACGWFTNYDERIVGGANQTGFDYTYTAPNGVSSMLDTDGDGQIVGGAPDLINRQRITVIDENGGWDGGDADSLPDVQAVDPSTETPSFTAFSGQFVGKAPANASTVLAFPDKLNLNAYRRARFAVRTTATTGAVSAGICFKIHNLSDSATYPDRWYCDTVGTAWTTGFDQANLGGSIRGTWAYYDTDLWGAISGNSNFGGSTDDFQIIAMQIQSSSSSNAGYTYVDGFRLESDEQVVLDDNTVSWTSGSSTQNSADTRVGSYSTQVSPGTGITPYCKSPCFSFGGGLWAYGFAHWYWKKEGGDSAAMVFYLHDKRSGAPCNTSDCTLLYYAGSAPGISANASIQVSPTTPSTWTLVRRNLLEDARQALNLFDDGNTGEPDDVQLTGYAPVAVNGSFMLIDHLAYGSFADVGSIDPTDVSGSPLTPQKSHPSTSGDSTFTYDFTADYPDGSRHYFNRDGLLEKIRDRDGQEINLDWSYDNTKAGPTAYTLLAVRAASDGAASGGTTFLRRFSVTRGLDGTLNTIRFDEDLGKTGSGGDVSSRAVVFETSGSDLVRTSPARTPVDPGASGAFCTAGLGGSGCTEFSYLTAAPLHRLQFVADPRWDTTTVSGPGDLRFEVGRLGSDPGSIKDRSRGSGGTALLNVLTFNEGDSTLLYNRPLWQDGPAGAAGAALAADLGPDGQLLTAYAPRACGDSACSQPNWPDTAHQGDYKSVEYELDGLAHVTQNKTYRCPKANYPAGCTGATELVTISRVGTMSAAKVDNYSDPLAAGRTAWKETADEVFASLRDSNGTNADLYRTEYAYDGSGQVSDAVEVRQLDASAYLSTVKLGAPFAYWRLNETSGATVSDSSGNNRNGSYTVAPSLGQAGALVRDSANKAPVFNGSTQYAKITNAQLGSVTVSGSYTVEAWVNSASAYASGQAFVGSRGASDFGFDAKLCGTSCTGGKGVRIDVGNGTVWLMSATLPFDWATNRWYDVVVVVDSAAAKATVYVDGTAIGRSWFTTSGTPLLSNSTHDIFVGKNGLTTTPEWFNGSIDEVAVYTSALQASDIAAHWQAGRAVVALDTTTQHDRQGRSLETEVQLITNPGFEDGANGWSLGGASVSSTLPRSGFNSLSLATSATSQILEFVPGQSARFQLFSKSASGTLVHVELNYWKSSTGAWAPLMTSSPGDYSDLAWAGHAYEITLPMDTDGRVQLVVYKIGSGTANVDDVAAVTHWSSTTYDTSSTGVLFGRPTDSFGLRPCGPGSCASPTVQTHLDYAAGTTAPAFYPAIFVTDSIANYTGGSGTSDTDVRSDKWYDAWGRLNQTQDPDGVVLTVSYAPNQTDIASAEDTSGYLTTMTSDFVGNTLSRTTPLGRVTSTTYDLLDHPVDDTAPDGSVHEIDRDNYGQITRTWDNHTFAETPAGDHDLLTQLTTDSFGRTTKRELDCGSVTSCSTGLDAVTTTDFDLLGNVVVTNVYAQPDQAGTPRTTANHFETLALTTGSPFYVSGQKLTRATSTGVVLPVPASGASAPTCPDGSGPCNSVAQVDINGRTYLLTDAYGVVSRTFLDFDGRPVQAVANVTTQPDDHRNDQNVTTTTQYDSVGNPVLVWLPLTMTSSRSDLKTYDALGRLTSVTHRDSAANPVLTETTGYTAGSRVATTNDGASTTATLYDENGRAFETVANADPAGNAGMTIDAFESRLSSAWQGTASGYFTTTAAAGPDPTLDASIHPAGTGFPSRDYGAEYTTVPPVSGRGRLHATTSATSGGSGVWWDLTGPTYQAGHAYKIAFDARATAGVALRAFFGQDASGGTFAELSGGLTGDGAWHRYAFTWTPSASFNANVHFAVRRDVAGAADIYLDNVVVWDTTSGWTEKGIVSSLSGYDADGRVVASVLPPGDPASVPAGETEIERPLVTTETQDPLGRNVVTVVNDVSGTYAAAIRGTSNLAAYFALDETAGASAHDQLGGTSLTASDAPGWSVAGALDEGRSAIRLTGANGFFGRASAVTAATANAAIEAWARADTTPSDGQTHVIVENGGAGDGWGLAIDASGNASGFVAKSHNPNAGFFTLASSTKITDGAWHHLVLTRNASTWSLYVDKAPVTITNSTKDPGTPGASFSVGALSDGSDPFVGDVDEVAVYTTNLANTVVATHYDAGRRPASDTRTGLTTRTSYDGLGRATDTWAPVPIASGALVYPQRTHAVFDRLGNQVETWTNYQIGVTATPTGDVSARSIYAYDVLGDLTGFCSARWVLAPGCSATSGTDGSAWYYSFDAMGRQVKIVPPVNTSNSHLTTTEVVYDSGGHLAKSCRYQAGSSCGAYSSRHIDYGYDALGRVITQQSYDRAASPAADTLYYTKTFVWNVDGTQASVAEGSQTLSWVYDTIGRTSQFKDGATVKTSYTYNPTTGTVATRTDVNMGATSFGYDWAKRETSVTPQTSYATGTVNRSYRLDGTLATQSFPASVTETLSYDAIKRPTQISLGSAGTLSQTYDRASRVASESRNLPGIGGDVGSGTQAFTYDGVSRVTGSSGLSKTNTYTYNLDSDRLTRNDGSISTSFTYDHDNQMQNQTIGSTTTAFAYDQYGNLTSAVDDHSAVTTYGYDMASRMTSITPPSGPAATIAVDALDRPKTRTVGTATDTYGYLADTKVSYEIGNASTDALLDLDGSRLAVKTGSNLSWVIFDLHGSVVALCAAGTSSLTDAYRYDAWGQPYTKVGSSVNPWRFRGLLDLSPNDTPLYSMGARFYAPNLAAFTQEDSVQGQAANPASMNRYLYALANPATLIDPDGHYAPPERCMYGPEDCAAIGCGLYCPAPSSSPGSGDSGGTTTQTTTKTAKYINGTKVLVDAKTGTLVSPDDYKSLTAKCEGARPGPKSKGDGECDAWWKTHDANQDGQFFWTDTEIDAVSKALDALAHKVGVVDVTTVTGGTVTITTATTQDTLSVLDVTFDHVDIGGALETGAKITEAIGGLVTFVGGFVHRSNEDANKQIPDDVKVERAVVQGIGDLVFNLAAAAAGAELCAELGLGALACAFAAGVGANFVSDPAIDALYNAADNAGPCPYEDPILCGLLWPSGGGTAPSTSPAPTQGPPACDPFSYAMGFC